MDSESKTAGLNPLWARIAVGWFVVHVAAFAWSFAWADAPLPILVLFAIDTLVIMAMGIAFLGTAFSGR